jgi:segregation and condensation protein B
MSDVEKLPELKEIVGAVLFGAKSPVTLERLHGLMAQAAEQIGGVSTPFAAATLEDVQAALDALRADLENARVGLRIAEVAHGYRIENLPSCGPWLRAYLEKGKPNRLSHPALETLAIIAYRQPIMRSEVEAVRGVAVDQILRNLLDLQLIRIVGRSDLPGRPWLFGTTQKFLEYFGLRTLEDLPGSEELKRFDQGRQEAVETRQMNLPGVKVAPPPGFNPASQTAPEPAGDEDAVPPPAGALSRGTAESGADDDEKESSDDEDFNDEDEEEEEYDDEDEEDDDEDDDGDEEEDEGEDEEGDGEESGSDSEKSEDR